MFNTFNNMHLVLESVVLRKRVTSNYCLVYRVYCIIKAKSVNLCGIRIMIKELSRINLRNRLYQSSRKRRRAKEKIWLHDSTGSYVVNLIAICRCELIYENLARGQQRFNNRYRNIKVYDTIIYLWTCRIKLNIFYFWIFRCFRYMFNFGFASYLDNKIILSENIMSKSLLYLFFKISSSSFLYFFMRVYYIFMWNI